MLVLSVYIHTGLWGPEIPQYGFIVISVSHNLVSTCTYYDALYATLMRLLTVIQTSSSYTADINVLKREMCSSRNCEDDGLLSHMLGILKCKF